MAVAQFVSRSQLPSGAFADAFGEPDTRFLSFCFGVVFGLLIYLSFRFSYCAVAILKLLGLELDQYIDVAATVAYVQSCRHVFGAYSLQPLGEPHAGC